MGVMGVARSVDGLAGLDRPVRTDEHSVVRGLWRAVDVFRVLALAYAAHSLWLRRDEVANLAVGVAVLVVLAAWTVVQTVNRGARSAHAPSSSSWVARPSSPRDLSTMTG